MQPTLIQGDCRKALRQYPDRFFQMCVTSPPYWGLRDYGAEGQIGREDLPTFVQNLVEVFSEVRRVLKDDGTLWLNIGDTYTSGGRKTYRSSASKNKGQDAQNDLGRPGTPTGLKEKDLVGIPWRVAFALQADGWFLRSDIIWNKPNVMPDAAKDRPTKSHEYVFLLAKSSKYTFHRKALEEPATCARVRGAARHKDTVSTNGNAGLSRRKPTDTRNGRTLWSINTESYPGQHSAAYPRELARRCILAGSSEGDFVLDPFAGTGTSLIVAAQNLRVGVGMELAPHYHAEAMRRIRGELGKDPRTEMVD